MDFFVDLFNRKIKLSEDRRKHILERLEMHNQEEKIKETLINPELIKRSMSNKTVVIYYKNYPKTPVTNKYLAVVVKINEIENFIITAYFTDRIKKGELIWEKN